MSLNNRLPLTLLLLRLGVFVVMLVWILDKFIPPGTRLPHTKNSIPCRVSARR